jgi:hypothetical protein
MEVENGTIIEGITEASQKVKGFLAKYKDSTENEGTLVVELYQASVGNEDIVDTFEYEQGESLDKLVDEVLEAAVEDADGLVSGGKVKYTVKVEGLRGRVAFSLKVVSGEDEDMEDVEDLPNKKGLITQQMRHNEKLMKTSMGIMEKFGNILQKALHDKDQRITDLERVHLDGIKTFAELAQAKHVQDMEFRKLEREETRKDQAIGVLAQGAPMLMSMVASKLGGSPPQGPSPLEQALTHFMSSISGDQIQALIASNIFSQGQLMGLLEMAKTIEEKQQAGQVQAPPQEVAAQGEKTA